MTGTWEVTVWESITSSHGKCLSVTWAELRNEVQTPKTVARKEDSPIWFFGRCRDGKRGAANVECITMLGLDYDAATGETIEEIAACWAGSLALIHTTFSHTASAPRHRLILALSRAASPGEFSLIWQWARDRARAAGHEVDAKASDVARIWFAPAHAEGMPYQSHELRGTPIDVDSVVARPPERERAPASVPSQLLEVDVRRRRAIAYLRSLPPAISGKGGHDATFKAALACARGFALPESETLELLRTHFNPRCVPEWSDAELAHKAKDAAENAQVKLGYLLGARQADEEPRIEVLGADEIFAPLPPANHIIEELDLAPGAPMLIAGYGFSGKTTAAMDIVLDVALGAVEHTHGLERRRQCWGGFPLLRGGNVLHFDYEMGARLSREKYHRLAVGKGVHPTDLEGTLSLAPLPPAYFDSDKAETWVARMCDGVTLCLIDSLRACAPTIDENSAQMRRVLDMLTRVSEKCGTVFIVIHHARKPQEGNNGATFAVRGSSAIFDAAGSVLVFSKAKHQPTRVQHEKARIRGVVQDDFHLTIADVPKGDDLRAGLSVASRHESSKGAADYDAEEIAARAAVVAAVDEQGTARSKQAIRAAVKRNKERSNGLVDLLITGGVLQTNGKYQIQLTTKAKESISTACQAVAEQLKASAQASSSLIRSPAETAKLAQDGPVDGRARLVELRRMLAHQGLGIYVDAAVRRLGVAGTVLTSGSGDATVVRWSGGQ